MLYSLLMAGGRGAAKNPNLSFGGSGEHSTLSNLDPIGNWITGWGGDPLNLYGNKDNSNALLFPSSPQTNAVNASALPFVIGSPTGSRPQLPPGYAPPQAPPPNQGLNFQGMPGFGAPNGQQPPVNPFLGALMQYMNPPKPAPVAGGGGGGRAMLNPNVMQQLAQMNSGRGKGMPMRQLQ